MYKEFWCGNSSENIRLADQEGDGKVILRWKDNNILLRWTGCATTIERQGMHTEF